MTKDTLDHLRFVGKTIKGAGRFSKELLVPGELEIPGVIREWPEKLQPGTLNILIDHTGYPQRFLTEFHSRDTGHLDTRRFQPEAELHHSQIGNNTLAPESGEREDRGNAQIWRAQLTKVQSGCTVQCWVLHRVTSRTPHRLECVAGVKLREILSLEERDQDPVELIIEGKWV